MQTIENNWVECNHIILVVHCVGHRTIAICDLMSSLVLCSWPKINVLKSIKLWKIFSLLLTLSLSVCLSFLRSYPSVILIYSLSLSLSQRNSPIVYSKLCRCQERCDANHWLAHSHCAQISDSRSNWLRRPQSAWCMIRIFNSISVEASNCLLMRWCIPHRFQFAVGYTDEWRWYLAMWHFQHTARSNLPFRTKCHPVFDVF